MSGYSPNATSAYNPNASAPTTGGEGEKNKTKIIVIVAVIAIIVVVAIIVGVVVGTANNNDEAGESINIVIQSSNTKEKWMETMVANFEADGSVNKLNGKTIRITLHNTGSSFRPSIYPNIWSPANAQFIRLQETEDSTTYVSDETKYCKSTSNIPVGVCMWRAQAEDLGWSTDSTSDSAISFATLAELALDKQGWKSIDKNLAWGDFKYGHGHPDVSNSGRLSVVANIFALSNATAEEGLDLDDVKAALEDPEVIALEQAVYHLGKVDTDILERMLEHGRNYLHAVANYESNVINWNLDYESEMGTHGDDWVFVYLEDGTFWMTHPLCVLDEASWTSEEQRDAALQFIEYTQSDENLAQLLQYGIRPPTSSNIDYDDEAYDSTITTANGVDPKQDSESVPIIEYPDDDVMTAVIDGWHTIKRPAAFALVIDTSGSMTWKDTDSNGNEYPYSRLVYAKRALQNFTKSTNQQDYIMARSFQGEFPSPGTKNESAAAFLSWVDSLSGSSNTPLYTNIAAAYDDLKALKESNEAQNITWNYCLVAMTDGAPTDESEYNDACSKFQEEANLDSSICTITNEIDEYSQYPDIIHFFPIIFGDQAEAALDELERMAEISAGKAFEADTEDLADVYFQISLEL